MLKSIRFSCFLLIILLLLVSCSLPSGGSGYGDDPTPTPTGSATPLPQGEKCDSFFWGKWVRMDMEEYWYISDRSFKIGSSTGYTYILESATSSTLVGKRSSYSSAVTIEKSSSNVLVVDDGKYYLYRVAGTDGSINGRFAMQTATAKGLSTGGLNNIRTIITNLQNQSNSQEVTVDENGTFEADDIIPGDTYNVETQIIEDNGSVTTGPVVPFTAENEQSDIGTITLTDRGYNYKFEYNLPVNTNFLYQGQTYDITVKIRNVGTEDSTAATYRLPSMTQNGVTITNVSAPGAQQGILGTIEPGQARELKIKVTCPEIIGEFEDKKIDLDIFTYDSGTNAQYLWKDSITLRFYKKSIDFNIASLNIKAYGVILAEDLPAIWFRTDYSSSASRYYYTVTKKIPYTAKGYTISLSRATATSEAIYSIGVNTPPADKAYLSSFIDVGANEPNDKESDAALIYMDENTTAYLHKNDVDFYKVSMNKVFMPEFSLTSSTTYTTEQNLTISTPTTGAAIYYTLDGSDPSPTKGILYTGPITLNRTVVVKAMGVKTGFRDSSIAGEQYNFFTGLLIDMYTRLMVLDVFQTGSFTDETEKWYGVEIDTNSTYKLVWSDSGDGDGNDTLDIAVSVFDKDYKALGEHMDAGYAAPFLMNLTAGEYYIRVKTKSGSPESGTYKIKCTQGS